MNLTSLGPWQALIHARYPLDDTNPNFVSLRRQVDEAYAAPTPVYPPAERLFAAFSLTPPEKVKCVILGQDPYHEPGQAHGLSFSVPPQAPLPPSLRNIYKELSADLGVPPPASGCLTGWAEQGVLLLNNVLTVEQGRAGSHRSFGWQKFTAAAVAAVAGLPQPMAAILWGKDAQAKAPLLQTGAGPRLVLCHPHPSPLSAYRGFFGSRPFSAVNAFLAGHGAAPIRWGKEEESL